MARRALLNGNPTIRRGQITDRRHFGFDVAAAVEGHSAFVACKFGHFCKIFDARRVITGIKIVSGAITAMHDEPNGTRGTTLAKNVQIQTDTVAFDVGSRRRVDILDA
eukprot:GABV01012989.1.p2 GENE.GABV01012989.1~~GABV01012989.1.p2  ORF type:complete len:108 (-),score=22.78 GABV01012989.1:3-326(-)